MENVYTGQKVTLIASTLASATFAPFTANPTGSAMLEFTDGKTLHTVALPSSLLKHIQPGSSGMFAFAPFRGRLALLAVDTQAHGLRVASRDDWKGYSSPEQRQAWLTISLGFMFCALLIGLPLLAYGVFCLVRASGWSQLGNVGTAIQMEGLFACDAPVSDVEPLLPMWPGEALA